MSYLPNFNIIEAKIFDLKKEALTWAFNNHPWFIYIGILTKKISLYIKT